MSFDPKSFDPKNDDAKIDDTNGDDVKIGDSRKDLFSRRGFLGVGSAALAAGVLSAANSAGQNSQQESKQESKPPYPTKGDKNSSAPGPGNPAIDAQNPDSFLPPQTDAGGVQTFKYPFGISHKRMQEGGWSREVTVRELQVSKSIAGVDMRLTAGGVRELHWHTAAEWAFMLYGNARITGLMPTARVSWATWAKAISGIFRQGYHIPFRG